MTRVAVLGGGPAGLAAAWWASRAGDEVVLFEKAERTGGMAGSVTIGGIRGDYGSHRLHPAIDPEILAALQSLPGLNLRRRPRHGRIRIADRWLEFPLRSADVVRSLPPRMAATAAVDALTAWLRRPRADTYAEVVRAGLGPMMAERFYNPYARKLWGVEPDALAGEQARRRISASNPLALARKVLAPDPDTGWYWYPENGFGAIVAALDRAARAAGADIRTSSGVERVDLAADRATVTAAGGATDVDVVLSTVPSALLTRIVRPLAPDSVRHAAEQLRTRAMVLVYLVVAERFSPYDAHYIPEPISPMTRLSEPPNYAAPAPASDGPGPSLLCAEIPCDLGDAIWTADDAALTGVVLDGIAAMALPRPAVVHAECRRVPHAYPVMTLDAPRARDVVEDWAGGLPRVATFGRHGLYAHDNTHHALAEARAAVDAIGAGSVDLAAWSAARARFRSHVVED